MEPKRIKCVIVGDSCNSSIGWNIKNELLMACSMHTYPSGYIPTIFENFQMPIMMEGKSISLGVWSTAGQEDYDILRPLSYDDTDVFILIFSVINPMSYENITKKWYPEIKHYCPNTPFVLVGMRIDERENKIILEAMREKNLGPITIDQGKKLAKEIGAVNYLECSTLTRQGVKEVFNIATKVALDTIQLQN